MPDVGTISEQDGGSETAETADPTDDEPQEVAISIDPPSTTVLVGNSTTFEATVTGAEDVGVTWAVLDPDCGSIEPNGTYTAPAAVPDGMFCQVQVASVAQPSAVAEASVLVTSGASGGDPGVWTSQPIPIEIDADNSGGAQTVVVDPVRPSDFYAFVAPGPGDGATMAVLRSTDFGINWDSVSTTAELTGVPWGAAIDPNPSRDPDTPPTLYTPSGFGELGMWKSVDAGETWSNLLDGDTVFTPYNPYGRTDVYGINVLPDDPPNHVVFTYHYEFLDPQTGEDDSDGGFGESFDGGQTWTVHPPPEGIGQSHYLVVLDAQTWLSISQVNGGLSGIWKTETGGRINGEVDVDAWHQVDSHEHFHSAFQAYVDPFTGVIYVPGFHGIRRSDDMGDTWSWSYETGSYMSSVVGTDKYLYANYKLGPSLLRATRDNDTVWESYAETPAEMIGAPPFGSAVSFDGQYNVIVMGGHVSGIWRFVEP